MREWPGAGPVRTGQENCFSPTPGRHRVQNGPGRRYPTIFEMSGYDGASAQGGTHADDVGVPVTAQEAAVQASGETPDAIMNRVNSHLSRTLPAPMEPMMSLIPKELMNKQGGVQ